MTLARLYRSLRRHAPLVGNFVDKDLKGRYIGSTAGFFWSLVQPLLSLATYTFVFSFVLDSRWSAQQPTSQVVLMMYLGIVTWGCHAEIVTRSTGTLIDNGNLIKKVVFPSEILPAYISMSALANLLIGVSLVLLGTLVFGYAFPAVNPMPPDWSPAPGVRGFEPLRLGLSLLSVPLLLALHLGFSLGLGYLLATLNLMIRDVGHFTSAFITIWMFGTPIFYPEAMVRERGFGWVVDLNPMAWLVEAYRGAILFGHWPEPFVLAKLALVALVSLWVGTRFFFKAQHRFADFL